MRVETRSPISVIFPSVLLLDCMTLDAVPLRDLDLPTPDGATFPDFSFKDFVREMTEVDWDPVDAILSLVFSLR